MRFINCYGKGGTAYEWQIGTYAWSLGFRWVHLSNGGYFVWYKPWRRFSVKVWRNNNED